ncbi:uncharacterized protein RJT20DRAFT_15435 [Scheffersomyces xylosifermentans]|uniref:uncharacterized protein n=1 Tax=Scheffersomyces xylosifermentans TaxID=1304137 RepID=UPI00315D4589
MTIVHLSRAKRLLLISCILFAFVFPIHYYGEFYIVSHIQSYYEDPRVEKLRISDFSPHERSVIFPRDFSIGIGDSNLTDLYRNHFSETINEGKIIHYTGSSSPMSNNSMNSTFRKHSISVFDSNAEKENCKVSRMDTEIEIAKSKILDNDLDRIANQLLFQLDNDDAFKDLRGFFKDNIQKQMSANRLHYYLYKFLGTSVWLEQHGVHYMVSRIRYSAKGSKTGVSLNLIYAQVFNEKWEEMKDVELVYPSRHPESNEVVYKSGKFPAFLPVPFYSDSNFPYKFYGPEDPRIFLVKNEMGLDEPLMVFNAYHRKINNQVLVKENAMNITFNFYRSMFFCWPFRYQLGKGGMDDIRNPETDNIIYNKVAELKRENIPRQNKEKNWAPFIDIHERDPYDKHIYFIYKWAKLDILKCKLTDLDKDGQSQCEYVYQRSPELESSTKVGPLRGGTEMIQFDLHGHSAWIGFARAHIDDCGCGSSMYRPNLAVLMKHGEEYKISYLSSFLTLDIPPQGWYSPKDFCRAGVPDVIIPNGISSWETSGDRDLMTLTLSVSDDSLHVLQLRNVLQKIMELAKSEESEKGYDENVVKCAIKKSIEFCKLYGEEKLAEGVDT